jgi:hypothetical protein
MPVLVGPLPTNVHSTAPISIDTARSYISNYLASSEAKPYLHPDCFLGVNGIEFSTHGSSGGVILHLLRRVERGLAGEILEPEPEFDPNSEEAVFDSQDPAQGGKKRKRGAIEEEQLNWEDPDLYALEQEDGDRAELESNYAQTPVHVPETAEYLDEVTDVTESVKFKGKQKDKLKARKDAKKARRKEAKKLKGGAVKNGDDEEEDDDSI